MDPNVPTRTPDEVLRELTEWLDDPSPYTTCPLGYDELASALRATLAENAFLRAADDERLLYQTRVYKQNGELSALRAKLEKAKAAVEAARQARRAVCIIGLERDALDRALAAYDKEPRDGHE